MSWRRLMGLASFPTQLSHGQWKRGSLFLEGGWKWLAGGRKQQQQQRTYSSRAEKALHLWLCIMERVWSRAQYTGGRACPGRRLAAGGLRVGLIPKLAEAMLPPKLDIPAMIPYASGECLLVVGAPGHENGEYVSECIWCQGSLVMAAGLSRAPRHLIRMCALNESDDRCSGVSLF